MQKAVMFKEVQVLPLAHYGVVNRALHASVIFKFGSASKVNT